MHQAEKDNTREKEEKRLTFVVEAVGTALECGAIQDSPSWPSTRKALEGCCGDVNHLGLVPLQDQNETVLAKECDDRLWL